MKSPLALRRLILISLVGGLAVSASGCLKTRAQLRDEDRDDSPASNTPSKPMPAEVKDVQPQGGYIVDELKAEITRLTGRIDELERGHAAGSANAGVKSEETKKLEARIQELEQAQANMLEALKKIQDSGGGGGDPTELYDRGKNQFEAGNYDGAVETLSNYLKNPKGKKAEDATLLRAEAYYALKQYKKAIVDYSKFPEKFTKSSHMPRVLYRIGLSFDQLGMKDDAKSFYHELVDKFPKAPEAKKARAKLR